MIATMFTTGRRLFTSASLVTLLVAAMHTFGASRPAPPELDTLMQAMQNTTLGMGLGMSPSVWDLQLSLLYTMSITLAMLGAIGLVLAGTGEVTSRVLSRAAAVMACGCGVLTALYYVTRIPPPLLSFGALTLLWGLSMRTTRLA